MRARSYALNGTETPPSASRWRSTPPTLADGAPPCRGFGGPGERCGETNVTRRPRPPPGGAAAAATPRGGAGLVATPRLAAEGKVAPGRESPCLPWPWLPPPPPPPETSATS